MSLQFLLDIARQKNQTPLPLIKPYSGPRLPPDRYCLTAPNYRLKSLQKKVRAQWVGFHIYFPHFKERILKVELKVPGIDMGHALMLGVEWNNNC